MIRRATLDDVGFAADIGEHMFVKSHWADITKYDKQRTKEALERIIGRDDAAVFVSDGGVLIVIEVPLFFADLNTVQELFFWALDGSGDDLRRAAESWARARGSVVPVVMGAHEPGDMEKIERWYRRAGYTPHGRTFRKVLS